MTWIDLVRPEAERAPFDRELARDSLEHEWHRRACEAVAAGERPPTHLMARVAQLIIGASDEHGVAYVFAAELAEHLVVNVRTVYSAVAALDAWPLWVRRRDRYSLRIGRQGPEDRAP